MATISWNSGNGDWVIGSNWAGGVPPGAADTLSLAASTAATISIGVSDAVEVGAITAGPGTNNHIAVAGGLTVDGAANFGTGLATLVTGNLLGVIVLGGASQAGTGYDLAGALFFGRSTASLALSGTGQLSSFIYGPGALSTAGTVTLGNTAVGGKATWTVTGTVNQTAGAELLLDASYNGVAAPGTLTLAAGSTFNLADSSFITTTSGRGAITNAGTIAKTTGTGSATIAAFTDNSGTISAASGTLVLNAGVSTIGTLSAGNGAALVLDGGGTLAGTFITTGSGQIELSSGSFTLGQTSIATAATLGLGGQITLVAGQSLNLSGKAAFAADLAGPGTLVTSGAATLNGGSIGSGALWQVSGTLGETGSAMLAIASGGTLAITASGSFALIDGTQVSSADGAATVTNAGTIGKTVGTGSARIAAPITNNGTVSVSAGRLDLSGAITNNGTMSAVGATLGLGVLSGTGAVSARNGGKLALIGGGSISTHLSVDATSEVDFEAGTFTFAGTGLDLSYRTRLSGGTIALTAGQTFTLDALISTGAANVSGPGTLDTTGTAAESGLAVGGGATWQVDGAVSQSGDSLILGPAAASSGMLSIAAKGNFNFADDTGIGGVAGSGQVTNAGSLAKSGGTGTSHVDQAVANTGMIAVQSGTLAIDAAITTTGALTIAAGGALQFNGGGVLGGTLANAGTHQLLLGAGRFTLARTGLVWSGVDLASLLTFTAGQTFTLDGTDTVSGEVSGAGALVLQGTTTTGDGMTVDDGATATVTGQMALGNGTIWLDSAGSDALAGTSAAAGTLTVAKGGALALGSGTVTLGQHAVSGTFNVAGTLTVNGAAALNLRVNTHDTGAINLTGATLVSSGTFTNDGALTLAATNATFTGAFNQTGSLLIGDQSIATLSGGGVLGGTYATAGSGLLRLTGSRFTLSDPSTTWAANLDDHAQVILVAGQTLALGGNDTLSGLFDGPGTVTVSGQSNGNFMSLAHGVTLNVTGALNVTSGAVSDAATLAIAAGGTIALTGDSTIVPVAGTGMVQNAGTITAGADGSVIKIETPLTNTGTITATGGKVFLDGATSNTGTIKATGGKITVNSISGHGQIVADGTSIVTLNGGDVFDQTYTVASGNSLALGGTITPTTASTSFATDFTMIGEFSFTSGQSLTLSGAVAFNQGGITGAGRLITTGTDTAAGFQISNGATWEVQGTVIHSKFKISGKNGTLLIDSGGTFDLADTTGIQFSGSAAQVVVNGTLTGDGTIISPVIDNGLISVAAGSMEFYGPLTGNGAMSIGTGAAIGFYDYSTVDNTSFSGTITNNGTFTWSENTVGMFSGPITNNGTIDVGSSGLTLTGRITGSGTLQIEAGTTLELGYSPATGQTIAFNGKGLPAPGRTGAPPGAHLVLDSLGATTISGIADADTIDIVGTPIQSAVISGNTVILTTAGGKTATLTSATSLAGLASTLGDDGHGGSIITFHANNPPVPQLQKTDYSYDLTPTFGASLALNVTNGAAPGTGEALNVTVLSTTGPVTATGSVHALAPGSSDYSDLKVLVNPTTPGPYTATVTLGFTSASDPSISLPNQTVTISGTVVADAVPQWSAPAGYTITGNAATGYVLDLGKKLVGYSSFTLPIDVLNAAAAGSAGLQGNFSVYGSLLSGSLPTGPLPANVVGEVDLQVISLGPGQWSQVISFDPQETWGGSSAFLPLLNLTVKLDVETTLDQTYVLDANGGTLVADPASNAIFQITAPNLVKSARAPSGGWSLTGGSGSNQFQLIGPGTFDLNKLAAANNIGPIIAQEGQRAYGSIAATRQGVILRDGATETLDAFSSAATAGNRLQVGIDIVAGTGNYTINLGTGHDDVKLGSGTATVRLGRMGDWIVGGNGNAAILGNLFQSSALIQGNGVGVLTLHVGRGGLVNLNAGDRNLTVALKAGSTLNMGAGSGIIADGRAGANTINLEATAQTAIGGNGNVLNGAAAGGDTFEFYKFCGANTVNGFIASGANHDMLAIATKAFADFAHVLGATKQVGSDLQITIDAADTILLKNVTLASFTSSDVRFF